MPPPDAFAAPAAALAAGGPAAAANELCIALRAAEDYHALFYALLLKARVRLGVSPFPTGPSADLPPAVHADYEDAIRDAGREVGGIYLAKGDIPRAWGFYRLIGEPAPVKDALAAFAPGPDDDVYALADIAWHQQVHPERGFDLILDRHGVCSAITLVSSTDLANHPGVRDYSVRRLVRALHEQLTERLRADAAGRGIAGAEALGIGELLAAHPELVGDDAYHIDTSHLSSVVQMSLHLPAGPELAMAREMCTYGAKLAPQFRGDGDPPFSDTYTDYGIYLDVVLGENVDAGLAHFRAAIEREREEGNTFPAEVYVNLMLKLGRGADALAAAKEYLAGVPDENLSCPGVVELARRAGDFAAAASAAKTRGDAVTHLAGLIAGR